MASLSASGGEGFKTTCVLYTIINVDDEDVKKNGYNAFKIKSDRNSVVLYRDFLRCFPLHGYGEKLIFTFKAPPGNTKESKSIWVQITDPTTPLPIQKNGTIAAQVKMPDNEGFVQNNDNQEGQRNNIPRRLSGTNNFVDTNSIVQDASGNDSGWANFSSNAATNVAANANKLKTGIKNVASSISGKISSQFKSSSKKSNSKKKKKQSDKNNNKNSGSRQRQQTTAEDRDRYYRQLYQFYSVHNPEKINSIDEILERFAGREDELFATLQRKYNTTATTTTTNDNSDNSNNNQNNDGSSTVETVKKGFWNVFSATKAIAGSVLSVVSQDESVQVGRYKVIVEKELAEGGFSKVYLVRDDETGNGRKYALKKMVAQTREQLDEAKWEMKVHRELDHPNIMKIVDASILPSPRSKNMQEINILLPLAKHGSLFDLIEDALENQRSNNNGKGWPFPEMEALRLFEKICEAVKFMHKKGYAHRDIKPHNVLLFDYDQETGQPSERMIPILMDLGSTAQLKVQVRTRKDVLNLQDLAASKCSPPYRAPELTEVQLDVDVDGRSDVFSLGGTLFAMAFGHSPFEHRTQGFMKLALLNGNAPFPEDRCSPYGNEYSIEFCDLITCMLRPNPSKRYKLSKVLRHVKNLLNQ